MRLRVLYFFPTAQVIGSSDPKLVEGLLGTLRCRLRIGRRVCQIHSQGSEQDRFMSYRLLCLGLRNQSHKGNYKEHFHKKLFVFFVREFWSKMGVGWPILALVGVGIAGKWPGERFGTGVDGVSFSLFLFVSSFKNKLFVEKSLWSKTWYHISIYSGRNLPQMTCEAFSFDVSQYFIISPKSQKKILTITFNLPL